MALGKVLAAMQPRPEASSVVLHPAGGGEPVSLPLERVLADDGLRIFTVIGQADVTFALARLGGEVLVPHLARIEVQ